METTATKEDPLPITDSENPASKSQDITGLLKEEGLETKQDEVKGVVIPAGKVDVETDEKASGVGVVKEDAITGVTESTVKGDLASAVVETTDAGTTSRNEGDSKNGHPDIISEKLTDTDPASEDVGAQNPAQNPPTRGGRVTIAGAEVGGVLPEATPIRGGDPEVDHAAALLERMEATLVSSLETQDSLRRMTQLLGGLAKAPGPMEISDREVVVMEAVDETGSRGGEGEGGSDPQGPVGDTIARAALMGCVSEGIGVEGVCQQPSDSAGRHGNEGVVVVGEIISTQGIGLGEVVPPASSGPDPAPLELSTLDETPASSHAPLEVSTPNVTVPQERTTSDVVPGGLKDPTRIGASPTPQESSVPGPNADSASNKTTPTPSAASSSPVTSQKHPVAKRLKFQLAASFTHSHQ